MPSNSNDLLRLVREALDRFELDPLDASLRRAIRIATLMDEPETAIRFVMELRPHGAGALANIEDARRFASETTELIKLKEKHDAAMEAWIADRKVRGDKVMARSLAEIRFLDEEIRLTSRLNGPDSPLRTEALESLEESVRIQEIARLRCFNRLCGWESRLLFTLENEGLVSKYQKRVTELLDRLAPDVIVKFNAAFRSLHDAASGSPGAEAGEYLSQAVTTCRRILKAIVDHVQPADPERRTSEAGHALNDAAYKNRLFEFLKNVESESFEGSLKKTAQALHDRFDATDALASKGVHADVALWEAEFCAMSTYLLCGEIVSLAARMSASATRDAMEGIDRIMSDAVPAGEDQ